MGCAGSTNGTSIHGNIYPNNGTEFGNGEVVKNNGHSGGIITTGHGGFSQMPGYYDDQTTNNYNKKVQKQNIRQSHPSAQSHKLPEQYKFQPEPSSGPSKHTMTMKEVWQHNQNNPSNELVILKIDSKREAYSVCGIFEHFRPEIEDYLKDDPDDSWFLPDPQLPLPCNIIDFLAAYHIGMDEIKPVLPNFYVSTIEEQSETEILNEIKEEVISLRQDLDEEYEIDVPDLIAMYMLTLSRCITRLGEGKGLVPNVPQSKDLDLNSQPFLLPDGVRQDELREFLNLWEPFDLTMDEKAAWQLIPVIDLVKSDTDMKPIIEPSDNDRNLWSKHRRHLANYFVQKYEYSDAEMEVYLSFADRLDKQWEIFQSLCGD